LTRTAFLLNSCGAIAVTTAAVVANGMTGSNPSATPGGVRTPPGVVVKSLLTVGDVVNGYRMAGAPDGLEAFDNGDGTFILLVHHGRTVNTESGHPREGVGTFVSRWWSAPTTSPSSARPGMSTIASARIDRAELPVQRKSTFPSHTENGSPFRVPQAYPQRSHRQNCRSGSTPTNRTGSTRSSS
jgi:hypothetical protein